jgi:hypothetical protein
MAILWPYAYGTVASFTLDNPPNPRRRTMYNDIQARRDRQQPRQLYEPEVDSAMQQTANEESLALLEATVSSRRLHQRPYNTSSWHTPPPPGFYELHQQLRHQWGHLQPTETPSQHVLAPHALYELL